MHAGDGAGENGFHRAALFFAGGQVHGGVHRAGHAEKDDHIADEAADSGTADFLRRGDVFTPEFKRLQHADWQVFGSEPGFDHSVAIVLQIVFDFVARKLGFHFSFVVINFDGV